MSPKRIVSVTILFVTVVGLVSLAFPSVVVPTFRTEITTVSGVLVVFPGLTSATTENSTWWYKVEMTNTVTVTSEVVHTDFRTISLYAVFGLSELEFTLLSTLIFGVILSGILLSKKASSQ